MTADRLAGTRPWYEITVIGILAAVSISIFFSYSIPWLLYVAGLIGTPPLEGDFMPGLFIFSALGTVGVLVRRIGLSALTFSIVVTVYMFTSIQSRLWSAEWPYYWVILSVYFFGPILYAAVLVGTMRFLGFKMR